jgi:RNA polymerase sigma factor (sigma-70 family)
MMTAKIMTAGENNDAELVSGTLAGNRDAFSQIVSRYQSLICSIAYSATGNLAASEDLAQETFVTAWKQLAGLREPEKLRAWLCGIARNLINNSLRKSGREPSHRAESLEEISESPALEPQPAEQTISNEEQAILWRSLERIPEIYREPLVLFYREHQSIEAVAEKLELTEDNVKQRLSRGRKLLHEQVLAFVEGALEKTNPGKVFTLGVLASLPALTISAKAATIGAAAAKGGATAKAAGAMGLFGAILSPLLGFFGMWAGYRTSMESSQSDRERAFNKSFYKRLVACIVGFFLIYGVLIFFGGSLVKTNSLLFVSLVIALALSYIIAMVFYSVWCYRARRKLLAELTPEEKDANPTKPVWEYRSRFHLLGLPFVHIRVGDRLGEPIKAWIAIGDCAIGVLFAFGGCAIAPISVGGCAVGLFSFGGCAVGVLVVGGMGFGAWVFGGLAVGWQAFGGCAVAWNAAAGGMAFAHDFALGGIAHAAQANTDTARQFFQQSRFFRCARFISNHGLWMIFVVPMILQSRLAARARRRREN